MNILITGSSGYIALSFIKKITTTTTHKIVGLSRRSSDYQHPSFQEIITDLADDNFIDDIPNNLNIDVVLHLVQSSRYREFPDGVEDVFQINVHSTLKMLEWSRVNKIKKFIYSSTGNVYQSTNDIVGEDYPCKPNSFYGASKLSAELFTEQYSSFFETYIIRIFGVYGPMQENMIMSNMINRVKSGQKVTLANNKGLVYTPLYIDDCIEMLSILILKTGVNNIYNFAGNDNVDLRKIVDIISDHTSVNPNLEIVKGKETHLKGNNNLFASDFDFRPKTGIKEGIKKILELENDKN